jgi:predicted alpha/beta-hydrolase family hydrolase
MMPEDSKTVGRAGALALLAAALGATALASAPAAAQVPGMSSGALTDPGVVRDTAPDMPHFNIYRPANLAQRRTPAPVIAWANGGCMPFDGAWVPLFERWAAAGYVVVSYSDPAAIAKMGLRPGQPPAGAAPAPGSAVPPASALGAVGGNATSVMELMRSMGAMVQTAQDNQAKVIDWATRANAARGTPLFGKLDVSRAVAAGNSCGGISSLGVAARDKRFKSVFVLSGGSTAPGGKPEERTAIMSEITVPAIWIVGGPEDIARRPANLDYSALPAGVPGAIVERSSGDHPTVSMTTTILADIAQMGLNWFRATLYHDRAAGQVLATRACDRCDPQVWSVKAKHIGGAP